MTRKPHYYERRAHAEGWDVEVWNNEREKWVDTVFPLFLLDCKYRVVPDADGWLPWFGDEDPPVYGDVDYCTLDGEEGSIADADSLRWKHIGHGSDIVKYRPTPEPIDPYAKLKAASADPTKQIRYTFQDGITDGWHDAGFDWNWDGVLTNYEIRDKPKTTTVKLLAWFNGNILIPQKEGTPVPDHWKRVPAEDKEIEVEE